MKRFRARTPVRIDFLGGGSDAPPFSVEHGGSVLNAGITRYAICTLEMDDSVKGIEIRSRDLNHSVSAESVKALEFNGELDLIKAAVKRTGIKEPFRLITEVDAPPQSGLGASAAIVVSVIAACLTAQGEHCVPLELVHEANCAERHDLGLAGGSQDPCGAAFGGIHYFEFLDPDIRVCPVEISPEMLAELQHRLLLVYSGVSHLSDSIHDDIKSAYADDNSACKDAMFELAALPKQGKKALEDGDLNRFAELLADNWAAHRKLHPSCTNSDLERFYDIAAQYNVLGGKTCGAGGGGCIVFVCAEGTKYELAKALERENGLIVPFSFDQHGAFAWECP